MCGKIGIFFISILVFFNTLCAKSSLELFGDIGQTLPFLFVIYNIYDYDTEGLEQLALGAGSSFVVTHALKQGFIQLSKKHKNIAKFSQRPNSSSYDGFPSGHTSFAFSAVGYAHKRYGLGVSIPAGILASLVGYSRVQAQRHTSLQVLAGALLGFGLSYYFATDIDSQMSFDITSRNQNDYFFSIRYKF